MSSSQDELEDGGVGPAVVGSAAIALLILVALLVGAVPYTLSLVGLALFPFLGGLQDLGALDLLIRAGLVFLVYALAEIPADFVGKFVTISSSLRDPPARRESLKPRRRTQGKVISHLLQAILLLNLLALLVTDSILGATLVALLTVTIEFFLDPVLQRYSKRNS